MGGNYRKWSIWATYWNECWLHHLIRHHWLGRLIYLSNWTIVIKEHSKNWFFTFYVFFCQTDFFQTFQSKLNFYFSLNWRKRWSKWTAFRSQGVNMLIILIPTLKVSTQLSKLFLNWGWMTSKSSWTVFDLLRHLFQAYRIESHLFASSASTSYSNRFNKAKASSIGGMIASIFWYSSRTS